jgi:peptide/nickel transport system permease protein
MSKVKQNDHYVAPFDEGVSFDELPDSAPSSRYKPSWTGWLGISVVGFWVFIAIFGPYLAPLGENDLPFPDDYSEFQLPRPGAWLGTDESDRDVLSRLMYGAGRTIGISFAATLLAYFIGVVMGIGAAISTPRVDMIVSRINDAFLSLPTIMLGLVVVAAVGSSIPVLVITAGVIYATVVFRLARALGQEIMVMDFRRGGAGSGRRAMVDHHPRNLAECGDAADDRFRASPDLCDSVHLEPQLPWPWCPATTG